MHKIQWKHISPFQSEPKQCTYRGSYNGDMHREEKTAVKTASFKHTAAARLLTFTKAFLQI